MGEQEFKTGDRVRVVTRGRFAEHVGTVQDLTWEGRVVVTLDEPVSIWIGSAIHTNVYTFSIDASGLRRARGEETR